MRFIEVSMTHRIRDQAKYEFRTPGASQDMRVLVHGVISEEERPKLIIEDYPVNQGPSVMDTEARFLGTEPSLLVILVNC